MGISIALLGNERRGGGCCRENAEDELNRRERLVCRVGWVVAQGELRLRVPLT